MPEQGRPGLPERFGDVLRLHVREVSRDLVDRHAIRHHADDGGHRDPRVADARHACRLPGSTVTRVKVTATSAHERAELDLRPDSKL